VEKNEYIDVYVICTPTSNRAKPLIASLSASKRVRLHQFQAIMFSDQTHLYKIDRVGQFFMYGRFLSNGEIGCAISHHEIYRQVVKNNRFAVILEDDARIPDILSFEKQIIQFFQQYSDGRSILSLLPWRHTEECISLSPAQSPLIFGLFGTTPLTVGYVITPHAANELVNANAEFRFLADWPPSNVKFYSGLLGVVNHGDLESGSLIEKLGREMVANSRKSFLEKSLLDYLRHKRYFQSYGEYFKLRVLPSLTWRIDDTRAERQLRDRYQ
jgi:GR25 family glycosyltransferase involved in LPS biosynthesis